MADRQIFQLSGRTLILSDVLATQDAAGIASAGKNTLQEVMDLLQPKELYGIWNQNGTSAPTVTLAGNTIGTPTLTRLNGGTYQMVITGGFPAGRTFITTMYQSCPDIDRWVFIKRIDANTIVFLVRTISTNAYTDFNSTEGIALHIRINSVALPVTIPMTGMYGWWMAGVGVTNPSSITSWADQSGNNNHLLQAVSGRQPRVITGSLGLPAIALKAGTNMQAQLSTAGNMSAITAYTLFIVASQVSDTIGFDFAGTFASFSQVTVYRFQSNNNIIAEVGSFGMLAPSIVDGTAYTINSHYDGAKHTFNLNGVLADDQNQVETFTPTPFHLFMTKLGSNPGNKHIYEVILYTRALNTTELAQVHSYLKNKYNHY